MQNNKIIFAALTSVTLAAIIVGVSLIPTRLESVAQPQPVFAPVPLPVIEPLATATVPLKAKQVTPTLDPTLKRICSCESTGKPYNEPRQFNPDGTVVKGKVNPLDTGMCQINLKYHEATATRLGYDLFTEYGNASYATWLYETQGTTPWNWSASCWAQ
jgi:hypothetical protein